MTRHKRLDERLWSEFGRDLCLTTRERKKGEVNLKQETFLRACKGGKEAFLAYLDEHLLNKEHAVIGDKDIHLTHSLTEAAFRYPPREKQQSVWDAFRGVDGENMSLCGFWGYVTIKMIRDNNIPPHYLASKTEANEGTKETGRYMLDDALKSNNGQKIDDCVRRVLRSMGNPAPRGARIVFNDFPLGRSYWRWCWAQRVSYETNLEFDEVLKIFDEVSYGDFSEAMHSKEGRSYISQIKTLSGLILFLKKKPLKEKGALKDIIRQLTYLSAWKAIELQSPDETQKDIEVIANDLAQA